jgi:hypothetical protein
VIQYEGNIGIKNTIVYWSTEKTHSRKNGSRLSQAKQIQISIGNDRQARRNEGNYVWEAKRHSMRQSGRRWNWRCQSD